MVETDTLKVRFIGFGASALKIEVFSYILTNEWNRFLAVREDLLLRIMDLVLLSGSSFAYPSQTFYMENGEGLDAEKQAMAEAEVEKMRQEGELLMDYWSDNFVDSIKDSIKFISRDHKPSTNMASSDKNLQSKDKGKKIKTDKSKTQGSDDAAEN
jgi:MscS family membrane protein